jgi:uncharacterized protein DUF5989
VDHQAVIQIVGSQPVLDMAFLFDFWSFLWARKKLWFLPLCMIVFLLGGLVFLAEGSGFVSLMYALF